MSITVFSWGDCQQPSMIPMLYSLDLTTGNNVATYAQQNIDQMKSMPVAHRAMISQNACADVFANVSADPVTFFSKDPDMTKWINAFTLYFQYLKKAGQHISRIVLDFESTPSIWSLSDITNDIAKLYADSTCYSRFPSYVKQYKPADYIWGAPNFRQAFQAFGMYGSSIKNAALRKSIINPFKSIFPNDYLIISNYEDRRVRFPTWDMNGWALCQDQVSVECAPDTYLSPQGQRYNINSGLTKNIGWNRFIDCINYVRSSMVPGQRLPTPWISNPNCFVTDNGIMKQSPWLWTQFMKHLTACGIRCFYYFPGFGPGPIPDNILADSLFKTFDYGPITYLPAISLDADSVSTTTSTGTFTTTYTDFVANMVPITIAPAPVPVATTGTPITLGNPPAAP